MNICIVRHGETDWNIARRLQGREDIPLNQNGIFQAEQCGLALKKREWSAIITSPLLRAKQTAECIAYLLKISEIHEDINLIERDYGKASGLYPEERNMLYPDGEYEGMEIWDAVRDRMNNALLKYANMYYDKDIIIVSHGSAINTMLAELSNHTIGTGKTRLTNACLNMFEYYNNKLKIIFYNKQADEVSL